MKLVKLITVVLGSGCALLVAIGALLASGFGGAIDPQPPSEVAMPLVDAGEEPAAGTDDGRLAHYDGITQRPLFNEDRVPEVKEEPEIIIDPTGNDPVETVELDVAVNGIIIAPDLRLAIVTNNQTNTRMRVQEGMPLEEEMSGWTLTQIKPRELVFNGEGKGEAIVELVTDKSGAPAVPAPPSGEAELTQEDQEAMVQAAQEAAGRNVTADENGRPVFASNADAAAQAEEIRRRVAERRAQLRAEAERRRDQQEN